MNSIRFLGNCKVSLLTALVLCAALAQQPLYAALSDLRITEVSPFTDQVEVTNLGTTFTTINTVSFCHEIQYPFIPNGTIFGQGEAKVFSTSPFPLNNIQSDIWLYRDNTNFGDPAKLIHGVKYGGSSLSGRENEAVAAGVWPSTTDFAPSVSSGQTLAWDGSGNTPLDWYVDASPSLGTYPDNINGAPVTTGLVWPSGIETFETASLGTRVELAITAWPIFNDQPVDLYHVRVANDVKGSITPRGGSTRWLRVRDSAPSGQNRFYSNTINTGANPDGYRWTFYVNLLTDPSGPPDVAPRFVMQHVNNPSGFGNSWGFELAKTGTPNQTQVNLIVVGVSNGGNGKTGATVSSPVTTVGSGSSNAWVKMVLEVRLDQDTISLSVDDGTAVFLPIDLTNAFENQFRFCFRGEGTNNTSNMLVDDIQLEQVIAPFVLVTGAKHWDLY